MTERILQFVSKPGYEPLKSKALARRLGVADDDYDDFRRSLKELIKAGKIEFGPGHVVRAVGGKGTIIGIYRSVGDRGFVRPHGTPSKAVSEIAIVDGQSRDAATGDEVQVKLTKRRGSRNRRFGIVVQVLERATRTFVGTYHERNGDGFVRIDGTVFSHSVYVGDPGAKGAKEDDKVVVEMLRFPSAEDRGEAVITEVLGAHGAPGVDVLSVIRAYGLPDVFAKDALDEARRDAAAFRENDLKGREDLTHALIVTIDPADARDHDDAVSLTQDDDSGHWQLGVHIADVAHFIPANSALDREARLRGTSVYLPQKVVPMVPELISNGLASLHEGKVRYCKSVMMELTKAGQVVSTRFANSAVKVRKRLTYEQVSQVYKAFDDGRPTRLQHDIVDLLLMMRELALIFRGRRRKRGALELEKPEPVLEYDNEGRVCGAHFAEHDISHQVIEEFMLAANVAVAQQLESLGVPFLRRIHPPPEPTKLEAFAEFARILGYKIDRAVDRFALQKVLEKSVGKPDAPAVHYALLRSLKQAVYSPLAEEHYALAFPTYCHFTSPIRRYPDLTVHRLLDRWTRHGKVTADEVEAAALGEHCSKTERRAEAAERELVKLKLMVYLSERIGEEFDAVITGVADYGFFAQCEQFPAEGRVHLSTLTDDYYYYDAAAHTLLGRRTKKRYRLGDKVRVEVVRVDLQRRQCDFRVAPERPTKKKKKDASSKRR